MEFFHRLFAGSRHKEQARRVYIALLEAARNPFFYAECGVPDTLDGRFDLIVLHLFIALRRLQDEAALSRAVMETYFTDMDRSLREIGVGDMGVSKRMKIMAGAFYGRLHAYKTALADANPQALEQAIARNVYGTNATPPTPAQLKTLADYMRTTIAAFAAAPLEKIIHGEGWPKLR